MPPIILVALALQQAPVTAESQRAQPGDVVVTGRRMGDELETCIRRGCPPAQEVEAAMNASTESFYAGRYEEAKSTLARTVARNKRHAAQMPGKMSDLYATYADVAQHEGDATVFRQALVASVDVLREHVGRDSSLALGAAVRIGDMYAASGMQTAADDAYQAGEKDAARGGQQRIAGLMSLRRVLLAYDTGTLGRTQDLLDATERNYGSDPVVAQQARLVRVRLALRRGDGKAADALLAALPKSPTPVLVSDPSYPTIAAEAPTGFNADGTIKVGGQSSSGLNDMGDYRWADIGFWIRPDGSTGDAQVLRHSRSGNWAKPLLGQIARRRYAPFAVETGSPGSYRIERFTLRPVWQMPTGSRIHRRMGQETLQVVDLTGTAATQAAEAGAAPAAGG